MLLRTANKRGTYFQMFGIVVQQLCDLPETVSGEQSLLITT